jgi:hypothetical protein
MRKMNILVLKQVSKTESFKPFRSQVDLNRILIPDSYLAKKTVLCFIKIGLSK